MKEAGILEIRRFFDYFAEYKTLLIKSLSESQNHYPRLLLAVIDTGVDLEIIDCDGQNLLNHTIAVTCERFTKKPVTEYSDAEKLRLVNSLAFIRVLSAKIVPDDVSKERLTNLFSHLKLDVRGLTSEKFFLQRDADLIPLIVEVIPVSSKSLGFLLSSAILSSVEKVAELTGATLPPIGHAVAKFINADTKYGRDRDPLTSYLLENYKARFGCAITEMPRLKASALTFAAVKNNNVLLEYLLDEGCPANVEAVSPNQQPLWCAACDGNLEVIKLLKERGADITKCVGIEDMVRRRHRTEAAEYTIQILKEGVPANTISSPSLSTGKGSTIGGGSGGTVR